MKNALILHGTDGDAKENWFDWLRQELEKKCWKVWVPDLPQASHPSIKRYNKFIFQNKNWQFNQDSVLIGHSSGAVAILGLLQALPKNVKVNACYLIGAFKNNLDWDVLDGLFEDSFDFELIREKADRFVFIHSDNDPYCPLEHAQFLAEKLDGDLIVQKGQKHFSVSTFGSKYKQFPLLQNKILIDHFAAAAASLLKQCRPGDLEHAQRVAKWVDRLAQARSDWLRLMKTAYVHDLGWYKVVPNKKLTKKQLKKLEPQANKNSEQIITDFLKKQEEKKTEIREILRLVEAADKHASSTDDEAIIVDADNLSKLNIDHVKDKYKKQDWSKMLNLWKDTFADRIKTDLGKKLYPELMKELERDVNE